VPACIPYQLLPLDIKEYIVLALPVVGAAPPDHRIVPDQAAGTVAITVNALPAAAVGIVTVHREACVTSNKVPSAKSIV